MSRCRCTGVAVSGQRYGVRITGHNSGNRGRGAYLGSYLTTKGGNWATHEHVDKLVAQMAAVTQATKEIEAKVSSEMWERKKKWETAQRGDA